MNERFIEWLLTNPHFSRRGVLHTPIKAAAVFGIGYSISESAKFIFPNDEKFGYFEDIDEKTKSRLLEFSPVTIAHRGGNSRNHLEISKATGVDFVEADIRSYRGKLSVTHGNNLPSPIIDYGTRFLGIGRSVRLVSELVKTSAEISQGLFLDLKERSANSADEVVRTVEEHGIASRTAYTGEWTALDRIAKTTQKREKLFYAIDNERQLLSFMDEQSTRAAQGVSLNFTRASDVAIKALRAQGVLKVFVYGANYSYEIIPALEAGADAMITGNMDVLELWRNNSHDYFFT